MDSTGNLSRESAPKYEEREDKRKPISHPDDSIGDEDISTEVPDRSIEIKEAQPLEKVEDVKSSEYSPTQREDVQVHHVI